MTPEEFKSAMKTFKALYLNWQFDTENPIQITAWYMLFKNLTYKEYINLCVDYASTHDYPPNSPHQLKVMIKPKLMKNYKNTTDAMATLVDYANKFHPGYENGLTKMRLALERDNHPLAVAFEQIQGLFVYCENPWENPKLQSEFSKAYLKAIGDDSDDKIDDYYSEKDESSRMALLGNDDVRKLGN